MDRLRFVEFEARDQSPTQKRPLNRTESICPDCKRLIPAQNVTDETSVYLQKLCPQHGFSEGLVWSDLALYERAYEQRSPNASLETVSKNSPFYYGLLDKVAKRSCLAILEITHRCNTDCPICIADAPFRKSNPPLTLQQVEHAVDILRDTVGTKVPIQLSGGEPTIHEDICSIVELIRTKGFESLAMDSNGLRLASKPDLAKALRSSGMTGVFLQFDGFSAKVYEKIRGKDLFDVKLRAIESCQDANLSIILQPTISKGINLHELWAMVQFGVNAEVAGVDFLPFTPSGRYPSWADNPSERTTISDVLNGLEKQSGGQLRADDFYSVPCQDQRCAVISYMLIKKDKLVPLTRLVDYSEVKNHYGNLSDWETIMNALTPSPDLQSGCCSSGGCRATPESLKPEGKFIIGCHGFQDKWNFDLDRARFCCFHELTWEGKLIPFCYYNILRETGFPLKPYLTE